jgi:hypothetical protein
MTRKKVFIALLRRSPPSPKAKILQAEYNDKKISIYCIVEAQPTFAAGKDTLFS